MRIALALYDRFTALDIIGPYQVLAALPKAETFFVAARRGLVGDDSGSVRLEATHCFDEVREADVVVVGGSPFTRTRSERPDHPGCATSTRTRWDASACTGCPARRGRPVARPEATSHWLMLDYLGTPGAKPSPKRAVFAGERIVMAARQLGIDMALAPSRWRRDPAETVQLAIEHDPQPPTTRARGRGPDRAGVQKLFADARDMA
jgi:hypothetical protein